MVISEPGTYTLSFGVVDLLDEIVDSALVLDNISVFPLSLGSTDAPFPFTFVEEGTLAPESVEGLKGSQMEELIVEREEIMEM
ncbi:MAG: hypothetical protein RI580_12595 [Halothece sp. Uz-M2-17]|nr:hypothetical protein [Halothece sp. Uz-M2-17]